MLFSYLLLTICYVKICDKFCQIFLCPQVVYQANLGKLNPQAKSFQYDFPIDCSKVMDQQVWSQELSFKDNELSS